MAFADWLGRNRIAIGTTLLVAAWLSPFAPEPLLWILFLVSIVLQITGMWDRSGYNPKRHNFPINSLGNKFLLIGTGAMIMFVFWRTFVEGHNDLWQTTMVVAGLAITMLPYRPSILESRSS